jgi:hypothetical protein
VAAAGTRRAVDEMILLFSAAAGLKLSDLPFKYQNHVKNH